MNGRFVRLCALAATAGMVLFAAACGGGAAPAPTSAPAKAAEPTKAAAAPAAAATSAPAKAADPAKPAAAAPAIQLKLSHHEPATGRIGEAYQKWADMVGEKTGGKVKITVYAGETLGKGKDSVPMVQNGIADIAWVVVAFFPSQYPLTEVYNLPMLGVKSGKAGAAAMWDLYSNNPDVKKEWGGLKVLSCYSSGVQFISTAKKPVRTIADVTGQKLRVTGWGATNFIKSIGGNPIAITPPEMYEGINKGVIDGMVFDWQGIQSSRLYEVLNYATPLTVVNVPQILAMNEAKWNSLPPDVQKVFEEMGGKYGAEFFGSGFDQADPEGVENFKKLGKEVITLPAEEQTKFRDAAKPIWAEWVKQMKDKNLDGQKALDQIQEYIQKYNAQ